MSEEDLSIIQSPDGIVVDVRAMVERTREGVAQVVNTGITLHTRGLGNASNRKSFKTSELNTGKRLSPHWGDNWSTMMVVE